MADVALEDVANNVIPAEEDTIRESLMDGSEWRKMEHNSKMTVAKITDCAFAKVHFSCDPHSAEYFYYFANNKVTAFQWEAITGNRDVLLTMLETIKTNIPSMYDSSLNTAMCLAAFGSNVELVKLLVDMGADVNTECTVLNSPIMQAVCAEPTDSIPNDVCLMMVQLLVERGVSGRTIFRSLRSAAVRLRMDVVRYLLSILPGEYKNDLHIVLYELLYRSKRDEYYDIVKLLLESGANPNTRIEECVVPREDVQVVDIAEEQLAMAQLVLGDTGLRLDRTSTDPIAPKRIALYAVEAVYRENSEFLAFLLLAQSLSYRTLEILLDFGFDPDRLNKKERFMCHTVHFKHPIFVALLLNAYCNPNPVYDGEEWATLPLDAIIYYNQNDCSIKSTEQIVSMMLEAGSNVHLHNRDMTFNDASTDVINMIHSFRKSPMALMQQCRTVLRKMAKQYNDSLPFNTTRGTPHGFVDALPAPKKIKDYIKMKDVLQSTFKANGYELCSSDGSFKPFNYMEYGLSRYIHLRIVR